MLFCSLEYLAFLTAVFVVYWALPWHRARVLLLLAASFTFYASWNRWLALIIAGSTVMDYVIARGLDASASLGRRKLLLTASLVGNLGLLVYFKYANFFLHSVQEALTSAGMKSSLPVLEVILPIGISFYTFEAINYTVDVYRRRVPAERDLANFMLFITFFPHLVAGPIVRARDFLPQINRPKRWDWARVNLGVQFLLLGLFKKQALADHLAQFVDPVFAAPERYGSFAAWAAMLAYAVQIYCDFSGYSDMALGSAHLLGFKLARNFNLPYLAANVAEFWHRWHISLSTWLRDYLFIPLGGSRGGRWPTCRNLLITMTLGGLWHGASWTFVVWGLLHGMLLVVHRAFRGFCKPRPGLDTVLQSVPGTMVRVAATFLVVCVCWVFFRATTFAAAGTLLQRLVVPHAGLGTPLASLSLWCLLGLGLMCHLVVSGRWWRHASLRLPAPVVGFGYAATLVLAMVLAPGFSQTFIYFQF